MDETNNQIPSPQRQGRVRKPKERKGEFPEWMRELRWEPIHLENESKVHRQWDKPLKRKTVTISGEESGSKGGGGGGGGGEASHFRLPPLAVDEAEEEEEVKGVSEALAPRAGAERSPEMQMNAGESREKT